MEMHIPKIMTLNQKKEKSLIVHTKRVWWGQYDIMDLK